MLDYVSFICKYGAMGKSLQITVDMTLTADYYLTVPPTHLKYPVLDRSILIYIK